MGYNLNIPHSKVGYKPFSNHLLASCNIQAGQFIFTCYLANKGACPSPRLFTERIRGGTGELVGKPLVNHQSGQIIATSHDLTLNGGLVRGIPLFQGNLGW